MRKKFYSVFLWGGVILFGTVTNKLFSQVFTRHLSEKEKMEDIINFPIKHDIAYYKQPDINFENVLEEHRRSGSPLKKVAVKVDKNYQVNDGFWTEYGDIVIWQIGFSAPKARSLNFLMKDLVLPDGAEMFVLSKKGDIIHGPIIRDVIYDQVYATDIIESTDVIIVVRTHILQKKEFNITIHGVCQGIPRISAKRSWEAASDCNFDVNCAIGNGWQNERDAVALVLKNGDEHCSGSLINNQCQDMRSFFLTAFHCLDSDNNGQLSTAEQDLSIYTFRFKFEAGTPSCPGNSTGSQGTWIIYSGAIFKSAGAATDFALIELNGNMINQPNIAVAGWDRNVEIPTQVVTAIHHPNGDSKKISNDNEALITTNANMWIVERWDNGLVEPGSSGSPLFDNEKRIIGQLSGGDLNIGCNSQTNESFIDNNRYGRFNLSWTGGGTNTTRLSNWLGTSNPPMTMNTIRSPWVEPWTLNNSREDVCTTNKIFTLHNPVPGRTVSWSVTNPSLFATTGGAATSGSTATATLRAASSSVSGSAALTFTMTQSGCNPVTIVKQIWVGKPQTPTTSPSASTTIDIAINQNHTIFLSTANGATSFNGDWSASGAVSLQSTPFSSQATYKGNFIGTGNWHLSTTNQCGSGSSSGLYNVINPYRISINNPVHQYLEISLPIKLLDDNLNLKSRSESKFDFFILDQNGNTLRIDKFEGSKYTLDISDLKSGMYFIKIKNSQIELIEKAVIIK
jgi:lysyl endopeptidase